MTTLASPSPAPSPAPSSATDSFELELRRGLAPTQIDGHLQCASRARSVSDRILAFYLDELQESQKYRDLGYSSLALYADDQLGLPERRTRELCQAGRALAKLTRIDCACCEGELCWTKTELLTHGVHEHEQDEWIERARRVSCKELKQMLRRHRKGLRAERDRDGGLPQSEFEMQWRLGGARYSKIEAIREELMHERGTLVDDSEVLDHILDRYEMPKRDAVKEAELAAACEQKETPDWLRRKVLARDGHRCLVCGTSHGLHVHHIVFRRNGGPTREENLSGVCASCHGLIHEGRLFLRGTAPDAVEVRNRFGQPLLVGVGSAVAGLPTPVLRLLVGEIAPGDGALGDGALGDGALGDGAAGKRSVGGGRPPPKTGADGLPETITGEWFLANMHLFDCDRNGRWRTKKPRR